MLSVIRSAATRGIDGFPVRVEVHAGNGLPAYNVVGLPDAAVRESRERVAAALQNSDFEFPPRRVTVNLAPAGVRKAGPSFDLPIALGLLLATEQLRLASTPSIAVVGELSLDGAVRPVRGALCLAPAVKQSGATTFLVPAENAGEAALDASVAVVGVRSLREAVALLRMLARGQTPDRARPATVRAPRSDVDLSDVLAQERAKRALEIAAAGGHHVLLIGPPGAGKTMLAARVPTLLPKLTTREAIEVTKIASVAGLTAHRERPFRAPHHTVTTVGMVGGGQPIRPGEISLAHHGVLFLDELPEFRRATLEVLRQPLEEGRIVLRRAFESVEFPCRITLVAAMNPCCCGFLGDAERECRCTPGQIAAYRARLSGPLLDRIDLQVHVGRVPAEVLVGEGRGVSAEAGRSPGVSAAAGQPAGVSAEASRSPGVSAAAGQPAGVSAEASQAPGVSAEAGRRDVALAGSSSEIRARVIEARSRAAMRLAGTGMSTSAGMTPRLVRRDCALDHEATELLRAAIRRHGLTARACHRVLKVARTIADLAAVDRLAAEHIAEAVMYRELDRC